MKRILILVEGQTEATFVRIALAPHLTNFNKSVSATQVRTSVPEGLPASRGGNSYKHISRDVRHLLHSKPDAVTTLIDFFQIAKDFPGYTTMPKNVTCFERAQHLEREFEKDIRDPRFIPNIVIHEFEALLFSEPRVIAEVLAGETPVKKFEKNASRLEDIAREYGSPEEINDSPNSHPAKRIKDLYPTFRKAANGPLIAEKIGLPGIRAKCRHFHKWLERIETF